MADSFLNAEQIDFDAIFEWLYSNAQLVKYGPWNGFGETIFNLMLSEADEKAFVKNAIKMHCLGIKDKEFNKRLRNFCNQNIQTLVKIKDWPIFFAMKGLS